MGVFLRFALIPRRRLRSQKEPVPGVALNQRLARGLFAANVGPGGVEVVEPGLKERIHHGDDLIHIYSAFRLRKAHETEPELTGDVVETTHEIPFAEKMDSW